MQLVENLDAVPPLSNRENVENFVEQSLLGDWVIRVEYSGRNAQGQTDWLQWDSTFFAIASADDVMQAIDSCYAYFPEREIRISAEKIRPATRMVYSVYRPAESDLKSQAPVPVSVASQAANQEWPDTAEEEKITVNDNSKWRYFAAVGTLAGTLFALEAASN